MKKIILFFGIILIFSIFVNADLGTETEKPLPKPIIHSLDSVPYKNVITQLQTDENYPCYVDNNQIVCPAINETQKEIFSSSLSLVDKTKLLLLGVPVSNVEGNVIDTGLFGKYLDTSVDNIIQIDNSKSGTFKIGFNTNLFEVVTMGVGITNQTNVLGGKVYLTTGQLTGNYWSPVADLNKTQQIVSLRYGSNEPSGSDVTQYVRTHNLSNGDVSNGLTYYLKMDDGTLFDYSGYNRTATTTNGFIHEGKFNGGLNSTTGADLSNYDINPSKNFTISMWFKKNKADLLINAWLLDHSGSGTAKVLSVYISSNDKIYVQVYNESNAAQATILTESNSVLDTNWHNIVLGYNGTIFLFQDGMYKAGGVVVGNIKNSSAGELTLGKTYGDATPFNGTIDEVMFFNKSFTHAEMIAFNNTEYLPWSSYTSGCIASPCTTTVADGRYVQVRSDFSRPSTEDVYLINETIEYTDVGASTFTDNPPYNIELNTVDGYSFTTANITLNCSGKDDWLLKNVSLYTNTTGTWHINQTKTLNVMNASVVFSVNGTPNGGYVWNCLFGDNATTTQYAFASANKSFSVATSCVDADCPNGFMCNPSTNTCYTSCNAHSQCNATRYCGSAGTCNDLLPTTSDCANKEWSGLTDNEVCINKIGYCFTDNVGTTGEFCTPLSTNCINDGTTYTQGNYICQSPNDAYQCLGGESSWSSLIDCRDLGDSYSQTATYHSGGYCGYYNSETCSASGCVAASPATVDCGSFYYTGSTCGIGTSSCDIGCGAAYDLSTCPSPNTLSSDCNTCTPSEVDNPPTITLVSPTESSTVTTTQVPFTYKVSEESSLVNCSLWTAVNSGTWALNLTNFTSVYRDGATSNYFYQNFSNLDSIKYNIECYDNSSQLGYGDLNITFSISTSYISDLKFAIYNDSETDANELFSVGETGITTVKNLKVINQMTNLSVLTIYGRTIDLSGAGTTGVLITNPYNEYIKFAGKSTSNNILFGIFQTDPLITTESGNQILFGKKINVSGDIYSTGNVRGVNYYGSSVNAIEINPTQVTHIGGEFNVGDGGVTIDAFGNIYASNLTVLGGTSFAENLSANGSFTPSEDNLYDIGDANKRWRYGYFGTGLLLNGSIYSTASGQNYFAGTINVSALLVNNFNMNRYLYNQTLSSIYYYNMSANGNWAYNQSTVIMNTVNATYSKFWNNQTGSLWYNQTIPAEARAVLNDSTANLTRLGVGSVVHANYLLTIGQSATALNVSGILYVNTSTIEIKSGVGNNHKIIPSTSSPNDILTISNDGGPSGWKGAIDFDVGYNGAAATNAMRIINDAGTNKVGIGTTAPNSKLTVNGNVNLSGILYSNATSVSIGTTTSSYPFEIRLTNNTNQYNYAFNISDAANQTGLTGSWTNGANTYDSNWGTFGVSSSGESYLQINYTKPGNALEGTKWQLKSGFSTTNVTLSTSCWNNDATKVILRVSSNPGGGGVLKWQCYYSATWNTEYGEVDTADVYEEAIQWFTYTTNAATRTTMFAMNNNGSLLLGPTTTLEKAAVTINLNGTTYGNGSSGLSMWVQGGISSEHVEDRTPTPDESFNSTDWLLTIGNNPDGSINHSSYGNAKIERLVPVYDKKSGDIIDYKIEYARDLSMTVSDVVQSLKDILERITSQDKKISELDERLKKIEGG